MLQKILTKYFLKFSLLTVFVLLVYSTVKGQTVEVALSDSLDMFLFSIGLIGIGYFIRRYFRNLTN
jgi:pilus assembly protein TadC